MRVLPFFLICPALLAISLPADAALRSAAGAGGKPLTAQDISNPNPDARDIVLPMPGGLTMAFRTVAVPAGKFLFDREFQMGLINSDQDRKVYERRTRAFISAPFTKENLPSGWLAKNENSGCRYYFIGKYEITNGQWKAVMGGDSEEPGNLPKTNISWYDIQNFLKKYNEWLLQNHAAKLPVLEGMPAFLRLPSEEEWEFAARGGSLPPEVANFNDFYLDKDKNVEDYAVFGERYDNKMPVGTKMPNNLGIYDMAGNAAEMVQTAFRFTVPERSSNGGVTGRLHGSEGGLVVKGGSFLKSKQNEVFPGKRDELRMFVKDDSGKFVPFSGRDVGARLVVASINVPGHRRLTEIQKESNSMSEGIALQRKPQGTPPAQPAKEAGPARQISKGAVGQDRLVHLNRNGNLLKEFDKVIAAASSPFMKSNLEQLRTILEENNEALERERDENLTNSVRSAIYKADAIRALAWRCNNLAEDLQVKLPKLKQSKSKEILKELQEYKRKYIEFYDQLHIAVDFYRESVRILSEVPKDLIDAKINLMLYEYKGEGLINKHMQKNAGYLNSHTSIARNDGIEMLPRGEILNQFIEQEQIIQRINNIYNQCHQ